VAASFEAGRQESRNPIEQCRVPAIKERRSRIVEDIFEPRTLRVPPNSFERTNDARGHEVATIGRDICQDVQSDGKFKISRIEIYQSFRAWTLRV